MLCLFLPNNSICITITNRRVNRHCFYFIIRYFIITRRTIFTIRIRCFSRSFNRCVSGLTHISSVLFGVFGDKSMLAYADVSSIIFSLFEPFMTLYRSYMYSVSELSMIALPELSANTYVLVILSDSPKGIDSVSSKNHFTCDTVYKSFCYCSV